MRKLASLFLITTLLCACKDGEKQYNGYIDADLTYLSSNYSGRLAELFVHRGETVHKNQLLFKLEQTSEQYAVESSHLNENNLMAQKQEILAQLHYSELNYQRTSKMRQQQSASQNDLDVAKKDIDVLNNQLKAIDFQIQASHIATSDKRWQKSRTENVTEDNGLIFDTYYTPREFVQAGQPVLSLITKKHIKVIFYAPEAELSHITLNQKIKISSDGTSPLATGHISYISNIAQYTPPIIYSREERQDLVFRVEASIDTPDLQHIHLGQPVSLELIS